MSLNILICFNVMFYYVQNTLTMILRLATTLHHVF